MSGLNYLEMSDEELMKASPPDLNTATVENTEDLVKDESEDEAQVDDAKDADDEAGDSQAEEDAAGEDKDADKEGEKAKDPDSEDEAKDEKKEEPKAKVGGTADANADADKDKPADEAKKTEAETKEVIVDYKAEYERLLAPFKANGRDIKVDSVDDAIALMQMGANYNKKMAALKPNLKLMKMLENNGLMSEEKIGFLIDLGKKDPAAINKLVKDSGIDPMDLDAEKAKAYKQTAYAVDDREIELDTILDEIQDSPAYTRTLDVVSNKWDVASKQTVSQSPQLLKIINSHIESGIYDLISTEVERGRMLGRLSGLSDIEAYRQVGDAIQARGGFNHLNKGQTPKTQEEKPAQDKEVVQPKPKKVEDDKLKDKRRAASSTQPAAPSTTQADFNPLAMSDEEFSKMAAPRYR